MDDTNGLQVERNAFWLLGRKDDFYTIQQIKVRLNLINLIYIKIKAICMRGRLSPSCRFLHVPHDWSRFGRRGGALYARRAFGIVGGVWRESNGTCRRLIEFWWLSNFYFQEYGEALAEVPILLILEPSLLMHTFNSKTEYHNTQYQVKTFLSLSKMSIKSSIFNQKSKENQKPRIFKKSVLLQK